MRIRRLVIALAVTFTARASGLERGGGDAPNAGTPDRVNAARDVMAFGAKGDGVHDDTAAIQAAINTSSDEPVFVPPGTYKVTAPIDLGGPSIRQVRIVGSGHGSHLVGNFAGYVLDRSVYPGAGSEGPHLIDSLNITNSHPDGGGIRLRGVIGAAIRGCRVAAARGIALDGNTFTVHVDACKLVGRGSAGSIGILTGGHAIISGCDIVGFEHGVRAFNQNVVIQGCRFEVNRTGIVMGRDGSASVHASSRSTLVGNSFEANDVAIDLVSSHGTLVAGFGVQGSTGAPSGRSEAGLSLEGASEVTISSFDIGGEFSSAAVRVTAPSPRNVSFESGFAENSHHDGLAWDVRSTGVFFHATNYAPRGDSAVPPAIQGAIAVSGISALDAMSGPTASRHLRGKGVRVPAGARKVDVVFPTAISGSAAAVESATATRGGSLPPGTYYYAATAANEVGETSAANVVRVTVNQPDDAVRVGFYRLGGSAFKRRIYRGTRPGVYDGYYETDLGQNAPFLDVGAPWGGRKQPPAGDVAVAAGAEPDASYAVTVTPNWNTTVWVDDKTTRGFRVYFGTVPPRDGAIDWHLIR